MAFMQVELSGAKRVPAKKHMQNRFPDNGPPLYVWGAVAATARAMS